MPRIRTLKPEHKAHRKVGPLSDFEYRLWVGLLTEADDEGRVVAEPVQLNATVFPYRPRPISRLQAALETLNRLGLIHIYWAGGGHTQYAAFPDWSEHQRIHKHHFTRSKIPSPQAESEEVPYRYGTSTVPVPPDRKGMEWNGTEWKGGECEGRETTGPASALHGAPAPASDQGPMQERHGPDAASPLAPELAEFMATLREAAKPRGSVPRRAGDEAV